MALLEEMVLTESVQIRAKPEKVFDFFRRLVDDASYRAWHPKDHVTLRWLHGGPWEEGSLVYAEEYIHGRLHKLRFLITKIVPHREIEFAPASRFLRIYFPGNRFLVEPTDEGCTFTAEARVRVGRLMKLFAKRALERGLAGARKHMREEGENLKEILESQGDPDTQSPESECC